MTYYQISPKQIEPVLALSGPKRYYHFIKIVVDWEQIWGLYMDGWALSNDDNGQNVLPLWPAKGYAELCVDGIWDGYEPEIIELDYFLEEFLPQMKDEGILPAIFQTPSGNGVVPAIDRLVRDLNNELGKYDFADGIFPT